jgi:hypothetical protein
MMKLYGKTLSGTYRRIPNPFTMADYGSCVTGYALGRLSSNSDRSSELEFYYFV